jgi:hypothetical protein
MRMGRQSQALGKTVARHYSDALKEEASVSPHRA